MKFPYFKPFFGRFWNYRFPWISWNFNPFLHTFPGVPGSRKSLCSSLNTQISKDNWPFVNWSTMLKAGTPWLHLRKWHSRVKNVLLYWIYPYVYCIWEKQVVPDASVDLLEITGSSHNIAAWIFNTDLNITFFINFFHKTSSMTNHIVAVFLFF